ncbi:MAG: insulinase family protein [Eubacterium sp.]|nr:insulinase family protein [Eubacterium sp.]
MKDYNVYNVGEGIDIVYSQTDKFKTNEIAITFLAPLEEKAASANALLFNMLASTTKAYPNVNALNKRLAMLYGASADCSISKLGENQALTLSVSSLADRFAIDGESISAESFELLMSMLFEPNITDGRFSQSDIKREKKLLCEKLDAEFNEKRIYSLRRLEALMFDTEPYSVNKYGSKDAIKAVESDELVSALDSLKKHAKIRITIVGNVDIEAVIEIAKKHFDTVDREYIGPVKAVFKGVAEEVKSDSERIDVEQGKLVLGYRINRDCGFEQHPELRLFCDVFGGGPYSKLFNNVREKLSLCYYCSARLDRRKSVIIIQCGCEEENMDKAVSEINNQLESIKNGDVSTELAAAKMGVSDRILSVRDDAYALCSWYLTQITDSDISSPEESAAANSSVTESDIIGCAKLLSLDSVFRLVSLKEGE